MDENYPQTELRTAIRMRTPLHGHYPLKEDLFTTEAIYGPTDLISLLLSLHGIEQGC